MVPIAGLIASAAVSMIGKQGGAEGGAGGLGGALGGALGGGQGGGLGGLDDLLKPLQSLLPGGGALPSPLELLQQAPTSAEQLMQMQSPLELLMGANPAANGQNDQ